MTVYVVSNAAQLLNNDAISGGAGVTKLAADWDATTWSSLSIIYDGTNWIETARSIK